MCALPSLPLTKSRQPAPSQDPIPVWSGLLALLKTVVMPMFCLISGQLSRAEIDRRRALAMVQLFATYVIFQALYHLNSMLAFRLNGFDFNAFPVQVFAPHEQVAPSTTSSPHS